MQDKVTIIAEAGVNHNGDINLALDLIKAAADAGVDYIKFQTFKAEKLVHKDAEKASYQVENTANNDSQFTMLKKLEIPMDWYPQLLDCARANDIRFLSTGFDEESIDFLTELGCDFFKVPSGELTNKPYLEYIASKGKPVIFSTGMADITDIKNALEVLVSNGIPQNDICVLHCNTQYPTKMQDVNLLAMNHIRETFNVRVGYSDHTLGIEVPIDAVALGAVVIEKHFTLDRSLPGPDHAASLTPQELKAMVSGIRNIEQAISGSGKKEPTASESKNMAAARKSIHFKHAMKKGDVIKREDLIMIRPGSGISPMEIDAIVGKSLNTDCNAYTMLTREVLS